jgi:hypothetical protein
MKKKADRFEMRLSEEEKKQLGQLANVLGLTETEAMRSLLRRGYAERCPTPPLPPDPAAPVERWKVMRPDVLDQLVALAQREDTGVSELAEEVLRDRGVI